MKDKITTSVVLSTYNGAKYIIEQLDSLRNQSVSRIRPITPRHAELKKPW